MGSQSYLNYFLYTFTSFLTIINPLSLIPVFLTMTAPLTRPERRITALKATLTAFLVMLFFGFFGKFIFDFFNISTNGLRVVGGILFFIIGFDMLQARFSSIKLRNEEVKEYISDVSITPLGIPMIAGPGAITNSVILMDKARTTEEKLILVGVMLLVSVNTLLTLLLAGSIKRLMGDTGNKVMMRLMGLIVMVIAVELFFDGLQPFVREIWKIR